MSSTKAISTRRWYRRFNLPFWVAVLATLACTLLYLAHSARRITLPGIDRWERSASDIRFDLRGEHQPLDDRIVILALDDETRASSAELWQTRRGFAALLRKIGASEPKAIGIDAFFSSEEINLSPSTKEAAYAAVVAMAAEGDTSVIPPTPAFVQAKKALEKVVGETSGDTQLADAIRDTKSLVLAGLFYLGGDPLPVGTPEPPGYSKGRFDQAVHLAQPPGKRPPSAYASVSPIDVIVPYVAHMGHVNVRHDQDGAVRRVPMVIERAGRYYLSLALKLASMELGKPVKYVAGDDFVRIGDDAHVHLTSQGYAYVGYLGGNNTFTRVSASELNDKDSLPSLKGKIVLVGYTDTVRDKIISPYEQQYDGVELHATLIHNILHGQILRPGTTTQTVVAMLAIGLLLSLMQLRRIRKRGAWMLGLAATLCLAAYFLLAQISFNSYDVQLEVVPPSLSLLIIVLATLTVSLATEGREKAQLRSAFGQYLQSSLIEKILQDPERLKLGGQRRELTVLFSDIRSFSRFSETLEPDDLSDFLNEYLTPMTDIVMGNSGMLDKYIGDAVMAVYGAPVRFDDHAERACKSALLMMESLIPMNKVWKAKGLPEIKIGIGINTGQMSVGNMGSEAHFDYTVMGDAVNLGARLESLTKAYGLAILVGEATRQAAKNSFVFREIDQVRVTGRTASARVFELCGSKEASPLNEADLKLYASALASYREKNWDDALGHFTSFLASHPGDGPSETMIKRIALLRKQELGADWDGVFEQSGK